jgi:hypothetical protein
MRPPISATRDVTAAIAGPASTTSNRIAAAVDLPV